MQSSTLYSFIFQYELLGNFGDFNEALQIVARDFRIIHWLSEKTKIQSLRNTIIRKREGQKQYKMLQHQRRDLNQELRRAQEFKDRLKTKPADKKTKAEKAEQEARDFISASQKELQKILNLFNNQLQHHLPQNEILEFLTIQQLRINKQSHQNQNGGQKEADSQHLTPFYSIMLRRTNQKKSEGFLEPITIKNLIISLTTNKGYELVITLKPQIVELQPSVKQVYKFQHKQIGLKVLLINFQVEDKDNFFKQVLKIEENPFKEVKQPYDSFFPPGKFKLPYREDLRIRKKQFDERHYSLAFQGGGAKGLAYVGAYRALKQNEITYENKKKPISITSIMGSSAGGMISLAVSTGISYRELQKICYKMKDIPKNDSFKKKSKGNQDEKQEVEENEQTQEQVLEAIKNVLQEYGILTAQSFQGVVNIITEIASKIMKPLLAYLSVNMPSIADILRGENDTLNLRGLLVKGALMKGDAVHDIGVQCLIKYFLKIYYENQREKLGLLLDDCFAIYRDKQSPDLNQNGFNNGDLSKAIMTCLQSYHQIARNLLNMPVQQIKGHGEFFVSIINNLIILVVENEEQQQKKNQANLPRQIQKDIMKELYQNFKWSTLKKVLRFRQNYLKKNNWLGLEQQCNEKTTLWDILFRTHSTCNSSNQYQQLKLRKAESDLLNFNQFEPSRYSCGLTVAELIRQLLGEKYSKYFTDIYYFEHAESIFQLQQGAKVSKFELQISQIIADSFETITDQTKVPKEVLSYRQNRAIFAEKVKDITMLQYYLLTNVQLTCTSVDLDDRILRLFNKKTTPFLPVCRAVQMSGSFPAAFKAQKWKVEWGKYCIYYKTYKAEIDLTGHQFTDGGLLANFPIRYLNNSDICKKYLSHIPNQMTTMLGFGLDFISENYSPNMKEIYEKENEDKSKEEKQKELNEELTFKKIIAAIGWENAGKLLGNLFSHFFSSIGEQPEIIDWTDINHDVLKEVPLIRFLMKLLDAYPNSDRNFNVQTFSNRVIHQNIYQKWKNQYDLFERQSTEINLSVVKLKNILKKIKAGTYKPTLNLKEKPLENYVNPDDQFEELILRKLKQNEKELQERVQLKVKTLKRILSEQTNLINHDPWQIQHEQRIDSQMVKKLAVILMMLIRQAPIEARIELTEQFIRLKHPTSETKIQNLLEYDISESIKRMVQYMYLKLVTKNMSRQQQIQEAKKITHDCYQEILEGARINDGLKKTDQNPLYAMFNYKNVKQLFKEILKNILSSKHFKVLKNGKQEFYWNKYFKNFITKIVEGGKYENVQLYCQETLKQNLFVKAENPITRKQYEEFIAIENNEDPTKYLQQMQTQLFRTFEDIKDLKDIGCSTQQTKLKIKNNFVFEAENIYNQNLEAVNEILLKELCRRWAGFITDLKRNEQHGYIYDEAKDILGDEYKYTLLKLVRTVTYQRQPQQGKQRFSIIQRKEIQNAILTIFFGSTRRRYKKLQLYLNELDGRTKKHYQKYQKQVQKIIEQYQAGVDLKEKHLECYFLRFLERLVLTFVIANKISVLSREQDKLVSKDAREMLKKYSYFTEDFKFIVHCLKQCNLILAEMVANQQTKDVVFFYPLMQNKVRYDYCAILDKCEKALFSILSDFVEQSSALSVRPNNTIKMTNLEQTFMVNYQTVKKIINHVYSPLKYRALELSIQDKTKETCTQLRLLNYLLTIFDKLTYHKFSIPLFEIDWKLTLKCQIIMHLKTETYVPIEGSEAVSTKKIVPIQSSFAEQIKFIVLHQFKGKFLFQKKEEANKPKFHLILEGVSSSNQYYCTILALARDCYMREFAPKRPELVLLKSSSSSYNPPQNPAAIIKPEQSKDDDALFNQNDPNLRMINAVTCSNFHVMFGFLLATNASLDNVKRELYHLKRIAQECENNTKIEEYFGSYQWLNQCTNQYKELLGYLEGERSKFFQQFQNLKQRNFSNDSLHSEYQYMSAYFKNETQTFVQSYDKILQEISQEVVIVDENYLALKKPRQICKRFAFDYMEQFENRFSYSKYQSINKEIFDQLKSIVYVVYDTFGTLVEGIFCSIVSKFGAITINDSNAKYITKGIIIKKLLSTFQLKEYITKKLKELHLSPSITLSKFYESAPRHVFLNLCTINMNEERLQFLNKSTMPFMPVWAAILASTALPFLYNYFSARQEWYGVQQRSTFYSLIVQNFFKADDTTKQTINYCSSNYISSLPLQIVTNKAVLKKLGKDTRTKDKKKVLKSSWEQPSIDQLQEIALAFSDKYQDNFRSLKVAKKYFKLKNLLPTIAKSLYCKTKRVIQKFDPRLLWKQFKAPKKQVEKDIEPFYWGNYLASISKIGNVANTFSTLINSNDNFVLEWYHDQLIKLPIKLGTLDFHLIVDKQAYQKHHIKLLSQKAKQTVERSYQITKTFTGYITQEEEEKQKMRYRIKMRVELVYHKNEHQFVDKIAKITILNHSKWNQNRFNNFHVYYRVVSIHSFKDDFKKATESEICWNIESGSTIEIKFYFPYFPIHIPNKYKQSKVVALGNKEQIGVLDLLRMTNTLEQKVNEVEKSEEEELAKVYYTRWQFDFRSIFDHIYSKESSVQPADTFEFEFDYLNDHKPQRVRTEGRHYGREQYQITPSLKKNSILYEQFSVPAISLWNLSYNEQEKKNRPKTSNVEEPDNKYKERGTDSVYISEWTYEFH